jgi:hypothetical protein
MVIEKPGGSGIISDGNVTQEDREAAVRLHVGSSGLDGGDGKSELRWDWIRGGDESILPVGESLPYACTAKFRADAREAGVREVLAYLRSLKNFLSKVLADQIERDCILPRAPRRPEHACCGGWGAHDPYCKEDPLYAGPCGCVGGFYLDPVTGETMHCDHVPKAARQ